MEKTSLDHILIIPDGNRRWAKKQGKSYENVYEYVAMETTPLIMKYFLLEKGIPNLTFMFISRDNVVKRSKEEITPILDAQAKLFDYLSTDTIFTNKISVKAIGDKKLLPESYNKSIEKMEKKLKGEAKTCNFLTAYDPEWEIIQAFKKGPINSSKPLTGELFLNVDIDLIIRSGFEKRLSCAPAIQSKYAELYFGDFYYPEFTWERLDKIISEFKERERRFGK